MSYFPVQNFAYTSDLLNASHEYAHAFIFNLTKLIMFSQNSNHDTTLQLHRILSEIKKLKANAVMIK